MIAGQEKFIDIEFIDLLKVGIFLLNDSKSGSLEFPLQQTFSLVHSLTMAVSERLITEKSLRSRTRVQACPPASCSLGKFTLKLNAMIIEPLLPPTHYSSTKHNKDSCVSLKGEFRTTVNPAPDQAEN